MIDHEDVECALKVVSCFFEPLGCEHRVGQLRQSILFVLTL